MALFIKQNDERSELQQQIVARLQQKARENSASGDTPDGVKDSQYIKNTRSTSRFAWVWLVVLVLVAGIIIWLTVLSPTS